MRIHTQTLAAATIVLMTAGAARAADIFIDPNGFNYINVFGLGGGRVAGPGIPGGFQDFPDGSGIKTINNIQPNSAYSIDNFHTSGAGSGDFSFTTDALGNIASIGLGGGVHTMATGVGTATLTLNTHSVTYNANAIPTVSGQTGIYYLYGLETVGDGFARGQNGPPVTKTMMPGTYTVDNLYNPGQFTEDFNFMVNSDGSVATVPGFEKYINPSGSNVNIASAVAHFEVVSSTPMPNIFVSYWQPIFNAQVVQNGPAVWEYEFDIVLTVGNAGVYMADFQNGQPQIFIAGDAVKGDNSPWLGTNAGGDVPWAPKLTHENNVFQFVTTGGPSISTFSTIAGTNDSGNPMTVTITAWVPEPASVSLLALGGALLLRRRATR
jgi:hypothetical protein